MVALVSPLSSEENVCFALRFPKGRELVNSDGAISVIAG